MHSNSIKTTAASTRSEQSDQEKRQVANMVNLQLRDLDQKIFSELKHVGRIGAWWNKKIVVYTAKGKDGEKVRRPVINGVITVEQCSLNFKNGFEVYCGFKNLAGEESKLTISHVPSRLGDLELFFWVPHFTELHWVQEQNNENREINRLKFALVFKAKSNWTWFNKGNVFAMDLKQFKEQFPEFSDTMF